MEEPKTEKKYFFYDFDDKDLGILALLVIALVAVFHGDMDPNTQAVVSATIAGIAGFVTGKKIQ